MIALSLGSLSAWASEPPIEIVPPSLPGFETLVQAGPQETATQNSNNPNPTTLPPVEVRPPVVTPNVPPSTTPPSSALVQPVPEPAIENEAVNVPQSTENPSIEQSFNRNNFPNSNNNSNRSAADRFAEQNETNVPTKLQSLSNQRFGGSMSNVTGLNSAIRGDGNVFTTPQLATVINREDLDEKLASNMQRAFQNEVGLLLQQTGNGQLSPFIRGLTGQQILILVDGIRVNNSVLRAGPNQYAATFDPGSIERIEVIRGAESALWGSDAIGGVINVVTRSPDPLRGNYRSGYFQEIYGTADTSSYSRVGFAGWAGETGISGGVSYLTVGEVDRGGGLGRQPATDYDQYAADVKVQRMLGSDHLVTVVLQHFEQYDLGRSDRFRPFVLGPAPNGSVPIQRPTYFDPQQRNLMYLRLDGLAALENPFADAYSVTISESRTKEGSIDDRYPSNAANAVPNRREISEFDDWMYGSTLVATKNLGDYGKVNYGVDFYYEDIDSVRTRINNPTLPGAVGIPVDPQYPDDSEADRVGTFLSWQVALTDRLTVTPAVRYENINLSATPNFTGVGPVYFERTYQDWIANVGVSYLLNRQWSLVGGYYEGFRAPTIDDLTANKVSLQNNQSVPRLGDLEIRPEQSQTYEIGTKYDDGIFRAQVIEFWTNFDSYITREDINNVAFLSNAPAYLNGTEVYSQVVLDRNWSAYGNFAYTYGRLRSNDQPLPRVPPVQGTIGLRWDDLRRKSYFDIYTWLVDRADRYNQFNLSDVRFIPGGTPGYGTLNLRVGRTFGDRDQHRLNLSLENLTDKYYRVLGSGVDGTGFNAIMGYEFRM